MSCILLSCSLLAIPSHLHRPLSTVPFCALTFTQPCSDTSSLPVRVINVCRFSQYSVVLITIYLAMPSSHTFSSQLFSASVCESQKKVLMHLVKSVRDFVVSGSSKNKLKRTILIAMQNHLFIILVDFLLHASHLLPLGAPSSQA